MRNGATLCLLAVLCGVAANSDTVPLETLRRASSGNAVLELSVSYSPHGRKGSAIDPSGEIYSFTALYTEANHELTGTLKSGTSSRVGLSLNVSSWRLTEERVYTTGLQIMSSAGSRFSFSGFFEHRLLPNHTLDPRVSVTLANPGPTGISLSVSYILAPAVLAGRVDFMASSGSQTRWLATTGSIGFVANARLDLVAIGYLALPFKGVDLPFASLGMRARIGKDQRRHRELDVEFAFVLVGESPHILVEICVRRRNSGSSDQ
ncbi:hypothetical protein ACFLSZ_02665 [Candidatus Bipolaricaulota bacterium]